MSLELLGIPRDFEFQGKLFKVCPRDIFIEAQFADWCMRETMLTLERLQAHASSDFYERQQRIFSNKIAGKQFRWGNEEVNQAAWSEEGKRQLLWLKIMRGQAKGGAVLQREAIDRIAENEAKWQELTDILHEQDYPDFFEKYIRPLRLKTTGASETPSPEAPAPVSA